MNRLRRPGRAWTGHVFLLGFLIVVTKIREWRVCVEDFAVYKSTKELRRRMHACVMASLGSTTNGVTTNVKTKNHTHPKPVAVPFTCWLGCVFFRAAASNSASFVNLHCPYRCFASWCGQYAPLCGYSCRLFLLVTPASCPSTWCWDGLQPPGEEFPMNSNTSHTLLYQ